MCFNIVVHNIILNGTETEQKHIAVCLLEVLIFLKIVLDSLNVCGFLMENSVTFQYECSEKY